MKPAAFGYHRPRSLAEALDLLGELPDAKPLAGGQSLVPMMNMRLARPEHLVDLNDIAELAGLREGAIGAMTRHHDLATDPGVRAINTLLAAAAGTIGHYAIRQRGTLGGSLVNADPAAQLPLIAVLEGAEIHIASVRGARTVAADEFFQSVMTVDLGEDEIVTGATFPPCGGGWGFELFSRRRGDYALAAVATTLQLAADGTVSSLRFAVGGVGAIPTRLAAVEAATGARPDASWAESVAVLAAAAVEPEEMGGVAPEYRRELVASLAAQALTSAARRAEAGR